MGYPGAGHRYGATGPPCSQTVTADVSIHYGAHREAIHIHYVNDLPDCPVRLVYVKLRDQDILVHQIAFH